MEDRNMNRRQILGGAVAAGAAGLLGTESAGAAAPAAAGSAAEVEPTFSDQGASQARPSRM